MTSSTLNRYFMYLSEIFRRQLPVGWLFFMVWCCCAIPLVQGGGFAEYEVKAAFLERFTRFIEWPQNSPVHDKEKPFVLGVIGQSPFGSILEKVYSHQTIKGKKVLIRYISEYHQIPVCDLLFICRDKQKELSKIITFTKGKPILTVGDTPGFERQGVLLNMYLIEGGVKFAYSQEVYKSPLIFNSMLLKIAISTKNLIRSPPDKEK